jgi:hypothetical protein
MRVKALVIKRGLWLFPDLDQDAIESGETELRAAISLADDLLRDAGAAA